MSRNDNRTDAVTPEFSRIVPLSRIDAGDLTIEMEAGPEERAALAKRFGLLGIESFRAVVLLRKQGEIYHVEGRLAADLTQACVVTLDPVPGRAEELFSVSFTRNPELAPDPDALEYELTGDEAAEPELLFADEIDVGEAVAQELSLALDPYPRAPEAKDVSAELAAKAAEKPESPFAKLARLRPQH